MINHSAVDPNLGYLFQGYYALLVLFDSEEEEASITVEIEDDIALTEKITTLIQVKHRKEIKKVLTIKSVDFWKTIRIWVREVYKDNLFALVTCDGIQKNSILLEFTKKEKDRNIKGLKKELVEEAERVLKERETALERGIKLPHEKRYQGCEDFLNLKEKDALLKKIYILDNTITIDDIGKEIEKRLMKTVTQNNRKKVANRIEEWWGVRVVKALKDKESILKRELTSQIEDFISRTNENNFIVSLNNKIDIPSEETEKNKTEGSTMLKQIELIDDKNFRKQKALKEFWGARIQRNLWITEDILVIEELENYDLDLIEDWEYEFNTKADIGNVSEEEKKEIGKKIYDYSMREAYIKIQPKIEEWKDRNLVAGSYQILSNDLKVGWHPEYIKKIYEKGEEDE